MKPNTVGYGCRLGLINLDDGLEVREARVVWWLLVAGIVFDDE